MVQLVEPLVQQLTEAKKKEEDQLRKEQEAKARAVCESNSLRDQLREEQEAKAAAVRDSDSLRDQLREEQEAKAAAVRDSDSLRDQLREEQEAKAAAVRDSDSLRDQLREEREGRAEAEDQLCKEQEEKVKVLCDLEAANQQVSRLSSEMVPLRQSKADLESRLQHTRENLQMAVKVLQSHAEAQAQLQISEKNMCEDEKADVHEKSLDGQPTQADDNANSSVSETDQPLQQSASAIALHSEHDDTNGGTIRDAPIRHWPIIGQPILINTKKLFCCLI